MGGYFNGRTTIEHGHRAIFDTIYKGSTNKFTVNRVRFISPEVAIVFLIAELKVAREGLPPLVHARPTLVAKRRPDGWKIIAFQNTLITEGASGASNPLAVGVTTALNDVIADQHPIKGTR